MAENHKSTRQHPDAPNAAETKSPQPLPGSGAADQGFGSQFLKLLRAKPKYGSGAGGQPNKTGNLSFFLEPLDPPPPLWLIVTPKERGFHLRWEPPARKNGLSYRVLRKADSVPWEENEGEILADHLRETELIDPEAPPGIRWFYAVFSFQGSVPSLIPCRSGPHESAPHADVTAEQDPENSEDQLLKKEKIGRILRNLVSFFT